MQTILRITTQKILHYSGKFFNKQLAIAFVLIPRARTSFRPRKQSNAFVRHNEVSSNPSIAHRMHQSERLIYAHQRRQKNALGDRQTLAFGVRLIF